MREFDENLEVAISGGGFRASAFGLGVLLYLVHSGLNKRVANISSVSGGSITNGYVAQECDFASELTNEANFRPIAARLAQKISGKGKYRGFWLASRPYLVFLFATGGILAFWFLNMFVALLAPLMFDVVTRSVSIQEGIEFFVVGVFWGSAGLCREYVVQYWIARTFFRGKLKTLGSLSGRIADHVFCATDLNASSPLFFSSKGDGRVFSETYGRGDGNDVPIYKAVAASAAFPPLIPAMHFRLTGRQFIGGKIKASVVYLSDGGVWNNLGTDWSRLYKHRVKTELKWKKSTRTNPETDLQTINQSLENCPQGGVLLIANASKPDKRQNLSIPIKTPILSFIITLLRVLNISVNSTVEGRSADIPYSSRLRMLNNPERWELGQEAPNPNHFVWGEDESSNNSPPLPVLIEMTHKPGDTARNYKMIGGLKQWDKKTDDYLQELETSLNEYSSLLEIDTIVPTTLDNLGRDDTLRMIVLGYLNTRETLSVAFANHIPPTIPKLAWFEELLEPANG